MVRTNEGGSVLSFTVVGVILAILMVAGVAVVRQQSTGGQKPTPAPQKVVKTDKNPTVAPAPSSNSSTPAPATQTPPKGSTPTPAPTPAPTSTPQPSSSNTVTPPNKELPHTGPVETATTLLAVGLLTASSVAYLQSRRSARLARLPTCNLVVLLD